MKKFKIEDLSEVANVMYSDIANNGLNEVEFIGFYEDVSTVLKNLLIFDETIPCFIKMVDPKYDDYEEEYSIILDFDMNIWCEKAYMDDNYLFVTSEKVYVADDCNSKLLENIETCEDRVYEVTYGLDNNEPEKDYPEKDSHGVLTRVATDKNGRLKGFEKIWDTFNEDGLNYHSTYSFFSSNEDMLKNILNNFGIKY